MRVKGGSAQPIFAFRSCCGSYVASCAPTESKTYLKIESYESRGASVQEMNVRCCIVGGGPAGMMTGFLLARAGVDVLLLEKHADFLRDFRGDTVHPSS